ncbi:MAG: hypothetical protein K0U98_17000 [Deltaproteobacteria bacterium]|nr:hypothetical protein [Deltaproteobacteria bacterium]
MTYQAYKVLHLLGVLMIFFALGAQLLRAQIGEAAQSISKGAVGALHGVGLILALVGGFGLIAKLGLGFPGWVWAKVAIWLFLAGVTAIIKRAAGLRAALWFALPILGMVAAYLAIYKPF